MRRVTRETGVYTSLDCGREQARWRSDGSVADDWEFGRRGRVRPRVARCEQRPKAVGGKCSEAAKVVCEIVREGGGELANGRPCGPAARADVSRWKECWTPEAGAVDTGRQGGGVSVSVSSRLWWSASPGCRYVYIVGRYYHQTRRCLPRWRCERCVGVVLRGDELSRAATRAPCRIRLAAVAWSCCLNLGRPC